MQDARGSTVVYRIRRGKETLDVPLRFESPLRSRNSLCAISSPSWSG